MATSNNPPSNEKTNAISPAQANPGQRSGKELLQERGTEKEKKALVIYMAMAKKLTRGRLLAVGVFLSVLTITSRSLIDSMKRVWKIRGQLDFLQLADRRFILEFAEEGDYNHVITGGPWRYREDAVIVQALLDGQDPETVQFNSIPIWVQFRKIPFYLLCKALARDLGKEIGTYICIDNNARGDICDKLLRARVHLPINQALRRWVPLMDGVTGEEVISSVHYERLPTFCAFCGFIGHRATECGVEGATRRKNYEDDLGVPPIPKEDIRSWPIPEYIGQPRQQPRLPWRHSSFGSRGRELAIVAQVAKDVGRLSVNDTSAAIVADNNSPAKNAIDNPNIKASSTMGAGYKEGGQASASSSTCQAMIAGPRTSSPTRRQPASAGISEIQLKVALAKAITAAPKIVMPGPAPGGGTVNASVVETAAAKLDATLNHGKTGATNTNTQQAMMNVQKNRNLRWKRTPRTTEHTPQKEATKCTTQEGVLGATRIRQKLDGEESSQQPPPKKMYFPVPSLEECLGVETLRRLREEEEHHGKLPGEVIQDRTEEEESSRSLEVFTGEEPRKAQKDDGAEEDKQLEAASHGAAGQLTGAKERTGQEP
jgi:hypothetical protein